MEGSWRPLDMERIDDTVLAEGKKVRYGSFRRILQKRPEDFQEIRLDHHVICISCGKHTKPTIALISDSMEIPQELFEVTSLKETQTGTGSSRKKGVAIAYELGCTMCEAQEAYERSLKVV